MSQPALILIFVDVLSAVVGLFWLWVPSIPWFGRRPGDIRWKANTVRFTDYDLYYAQSAGECHTMGDAAVLAMRDVETTDMRSWFDVRHAESFWQK